MRMYIDPRELVKEKKAREKAAARGRRKRELRQAKGLKCVEFWVPENMVSQIKELVSGALKSNDANSEEVT